MRLSDLCWRGALFAAFSLLGLTTAVAEDAAPFERRVSIDFRALSKDLFKLTETSETKIIAPSAVTTFGQINLPTNEHFFTVESLAGR